MHCKDTRIAVQVRTNKPFNGRIYALGRSETCNIDVINSDAFRLDLTMAGQDCNTQSVVSGQKMRCQGNERQHLTLHPPPFTLLSSGRLASTPTQWCCSITAWS